MALPKKKQVIDLSPIKLQNEIITIKKQLFELRIKKATGQILKPHLFKHLQHRLKQLIFIYELFCKNLYKKRVKFNKE